MLRTSLGGLAMVGLVWFSSGCSGGEDACKSLEAYDCIRPLTAEAEPCGHPFSTVGLLASDSLSCTFDDGTTVEWAASVRDVSPNDDGHYGFTVTKGGEVCLRFDQDVQGDITTTVVETSGGVYQEVREEKVNSISFATTCPGGVTFDDTEVRECDGNTDFRHIGYNYTGQGSGGFFDVEFRLGTARGFDQQFFELFKCAGF